MPIIKQDDKTDIENYRSVSVLHIFQRFLRIMNDRLISFIGSNLTSVNLTSLVM